MRENAVKPVRAFLNVLILTEKEIKHLLTMGEAIKVVETTFREKEFRRVQMPPKMYLFYKKYDGDLRVMPSYLEKLDLSGVKIVNVHPENPEKYKLPTVMATIILIDPKTGAPQAIMDGTWITAMRTGAASGVATKYLARKDDSIIGLIGAGVQARTQLLALSKVRKIKKVNVWSKSREIGEKFVKEMVVKLKKPIKLVNMVKDAVKGADIIVTATPSREPIVMNSWIKPGVHINAIGADAPGKEELDPAILKRAKIIVDDVAQAIHSGEINVPITKGIITKKAIYCELGDIVTEKKPGRTSENEITVFCSTGLSIQDVATAAVVYKKAARRNLGYKLSYYG